MYPISLPDDWLATDQHKISNQQARDWVCSESSLTIRIKELGISFSLEVLNQTEQVLTKSMQKLLSTNDTSAMFREVLLKQAGIPLIYAQTIIPSSTISGTEKMLAELGNQPLGQVLFQSPKSIRGNIQYSLVKNNSQLGRYIETVLNQPMQEPSYIRRSVFRLNHKPLLVCECFLPALFISDDSLGELHEARYNKGQVN